MLRFFSHPRNLPYKLALPVPLGFGTGVLHHTDPQAGGSDVGAAGVEMDVTIGDQAHQAGPEGDNAMEEDTPTDDGKAAAGVGHSPLTYGKVFGAIPRMTKAINTPVINSRISDMFGLPHLSSSKDFKKVYSDGREVLR